MNIWNRADMGAQNGKLAIVTGATGGIGFECALALAGAGAEVILLGRNESKGQSALAKIKAAGAPARFELVDFASLASINNFVERFLKEGKPIDALINNAAVMSLPKRQCTADGFELQFGTNHLGHFALTAGLLPALLKSKKSVVTTVSSLAHKRGTIKFDDLQGEKRYGPWAAYQQSKLANVLFMLELQRRSNANGWRLISNGAHPGYARTDILVNGPGLDAPLSKVSLFIRPYLSHSAADGALPVLYAAVSPEAEPSGYYGPGGFFEMKGPVAKAGIASQAKDESTAKRLWDISEKLVSIKFPAESTGVVNVGRKTT
jgi:NAD(P)-dependent dehydrogenase (short-subunit alcohol dehydrogenase family)